MSEETVNEGTVENKDKEEAVEETIFSDAFESALNESDNSESDDDQDKESDEKNVEDGKFKDNDIIEDEKNNDYQNDKVDKSKKSDDNKTEDFEQKWKSLDGIIKSEQKKHEDVVTSLTSQIMALTEKIEVMSKSNKNDAVKDEGDDLTEDQKKALNAYEEEFDAVSKMEGLKREKALAKLRKEIVGDFENKITTLESKLRERVEPIEQTLQQDDEVKHFGNIRTAHPDFETYRDNGAILKWIESKPKYIQGSLNSIYNAGSAEDVIGLISDFKIENNITKQEQTNDAETEKIKAQKEAKKQALTAVPAKKTAVNTKKSDPDDFESAFDEAIKKIKS